YRIQIECPEYWLTFINSQLTYLSIKALDSHRAHIQRIERKAGEIGSENVMNRLTQTLLTAALLCVVTAMAQAQWVVAFQDKSKRDLNGMFFMGGRYGWVIGDRGIIHATQDDGGEWVAQDSRLNDNLNDIFFRTRDEGWLVTSSATGSRI